jgi:homoserine O-acetyltransferase
MPESRPARHIRFNAPFDLVSGATLPGIEAAYHLYGNPGDGRPVIWVFHALTGNSDPMAWWGGIVGPGRVIDPARHTIVCANVLGSCYGSTGPGSVNPATGTPWLRDFPLVTIRDMVAAHELLREHLGIGQIDLAVGSSLGAFQALEWAVGHPHRIRRLLFIAASARCSPWAKAFNEAQRMAIRADQTYWGNHPKGGQEGLKAARAIGMLSYRSHDAYGTTQDDGETENPEGYRACSYQRYQGEKLAGRFNAHAYVTLTRAFDSHDVGRGRGGIKTALSAVRAMTRCVGIETDLLFPPQEVAQVAGGIPGASCRHIRSLYGHDGFLVENDAMAEIIREWLP